MQWEATNGKSQLITPVRGSHCGETVKKSLSVRTHNCPHCGYIEDRDVNAAKNILQCGLTMVGHTESHTLGEIDPLASLEQSCGIMVSP